VPILGGGAIQGGIRPLAMDRFTRARDDDAFARLEAVALFISTTLRL
jgi:hypothetical protein